MTKIKPTIHRTNGSSTPSPTGGNEDKQIDFAGEVSTLHDSSRLKSHVNSIAESSANKTDQENVVQSNEKKRSSTSSMFSIAEKLEKREATTNHHPVSDVTPTIRSQQKILKSRLYIKVQTCVSYW